MNPDARDSFGAYSPSITISLEIRSEKLAVAQVGPEFLVLRSSVDFPPTRAALIVTVDGEPVRQEIDLPQGIKGGQRRHPIVLLEDRSTLAKAG
jgi:hypothetical protein